MRTHPCTRYRRSRGITMAAYARELGVSRQRVHQIEHDDQPPGRELLQRIVVNSQGQIGLLEMFEWIERAEKRKARAAKVKA